MEQEARKWQLPPCQAVWFSCATSQARAQISKKMSWVRSGGHSLPPNFPPVFHVPTLQLPTQLLASLNTEMQVSFPSSSVSWFCQRDLAHGG